MKTLFSLILMVFAATAVTHAQKFTTEFGLGYTYMAPSGSMKKHIHDGHGITADYYLIPLGKHFAFGLEWSHTRYGKEKTTQLYSFEDGSTAPMDVIVDNGIISCALGARYFLRKEGSLKPYLTGRFGYSWFRTMLNIYDPNDADHCKPVESSILMKDGTFYFSAGAGIQYDISRLFNREQSNRLIITFGLNKFLGGEVRYMNSDAPEYPQHQTGNEVTAHF